MGCGPQETFRACSDIQIQDQENIWENAIEAKNDERKKVKVVRKKVIGVKHFKPYLLSVITLNDRKTNTKLLSRKHFSPNTNNQKEVKILNSLEKPIDIKTIYHLINSVETCRAVGNHID